jgi:hypothetical protein
LNLHFFLPNIFRNYLLHILAPLSSTGPRVLKNVTNLHEVLKILWGGELVLSSNWHFRLYSLRLKD